jgi:hypothetical protein
MESVACIRKTLSLTVGIEYSWGVEQGGSRFYGCVDITHSIYTALTGVKEVPLVLS